MAAIGKGAEEAGEWAYQRSLAAMRRQWAVYDHEKVFWNSTWTVGLIGLGWVAVQLGKFIIGTITPVQQAARIFTDADRASYDWLYPYCDPSGDKFTEPYPGTHGTIVQYYRDNPSEWEAYKARIVEKYGDASAKPVAEMPFNISSVIDNLDKFYVSFGPVMPIAAVLGHMGLESLRVYRVRKRLK